MRYRSFFSRPRPDWWPENEAWPPVRRIRRHSYFRRMGFLIGLLNLLGLIILVGIIALITRKMGLVNITFAPSHWQVPFAIGFIPFVIIMMVLGGVRLHRIVVPLDDLLKAADRVGQGDYSIRVVEKGSREVRSLARAFNDMTSRLDQLDEHRRNLLADVTHELRTPLTVVQGNLEGMLDGVYPADGLMLRSLIDETKIISRLVEDLRTLALAESGTLQLKKEPTDLAMLARETATTFQTQTDAAGVTLSVDIPSDLPWLEVDPGRIRQVLTNLLVNALRYTPADGRLSIRYRQEKGVAILEVQDSGVGIPAEELSHVFERFYKSSESGGMGLGLAIAKHLVEAHGGTITAESAPGQGTRIKVVLPLET